MKINNKVLLASMFTFTTAFITLMCLFAMNGFSFQTVVALASASFFAYLTKCFFKVENILRYRQAKISVTHNSNVVMRVVSCENKHKKTA